MSTSNAQRKAFWAALLIGVSIAIIWIFLLPKRVPSDTIEGFGASTEEFTQETSEIWSQTQESRGDISNQLQEAQQNAATDSPTQDPLNSPE